MLPGELLRSNANPVNTEGEQRAGLKAVFAVSVFQIEGTQAKLDITIEHKNEDDMQWTLAATFASITTPGLYSKELAAPKQVCRLSLVLAGEKAWARVSELETLWAL